MSGSLAAYQSMSYQSTIYQAWLPPDPIPQPLQQWIDIGAIIVNPASRYIGWFEVVYNTWQVPDPLPILPKYVVQSAGATTSVYKDKGLWQNVVLSSWVPPDPLPTLPIQYNKLFTPSGNSAYIKPVGGNSVTPPHNVSAFGAIPVYVVPNTATGGVTPLAGVNTYIAVGGTAVVVAIGPCNGGLIVNPTTAGGQGIMTAENLNLSMSGPPISGDASAFGATFLLSSTLGSNSFTIPPLAPGVMLWANATTSGHRFTAIIW